jgi:hypothetical protein
MESRRAVSIAVASAMVVLALNTIQLPPSGYTYNQVAIQDPIQALGSASPYACQGFNVTNGNYNIYSYNGGITPTIQGNQVYIAYPPADWTGYFSGGDAVSYRSCQATHISFDAQFVTLGSDIRTPGVPISEEAVFFSDDTNHYTSQEVGIIAHFGPDHTISGYVQDGNGGNTSTMFQTRPLFINDGQAHHFDIRISSSNGQNVVSFSVDGTAVASVAFDSNVDYSTVAWHAIFTCHRFSESWDGRNSHELAGNLVLS